MTPTRTVLRNLVLRVLVSESALVGPEADGASWQSLARSTAGHAVILDLAPVSCMDAGGLGILVAFAEAVRARGGELRLDHVQPYVRRMVEVTGLAEAIGLHLVSP